MLTNLVRQAILRGDPVVVIDPKSSKRLRNAVFAACRAAGRAKPREFHPAFPDRGIRFDPFGSFARATELATRVKAVMPADTSGAFSSFAWQAVLVVVEGLLFVDRRPSLRRLADTIESGIDALLDECLTKHLTDFGPEDWPARVRAKLDEVEEQGFRRGERNLELSAKALFWEETVKPKHPEPVLNRLIDTYRHDREHYAKITASLMPVLAMLTAGSLAKSLSPRPRGSRRPQRRGDARRNHRGGRGFLRGIGRASRFDRCLRLGEHSLGGPHGLGGRALQRRALGGVGGAHFALCGRGLQRDQRTPH